VSDTPVISLVGGTGSLGLALARRWASSKYPVIIGSRNAEQAAAAARSLRDTSGAAVQGCENRQAAELGDIVVVTVPFASHTAVLDHIRPAVRGKLVIDATVPLIPPKVARVQLPAEGSAAVIAQRILGEDVIVVSAFHLVAARALASDEKVDSDVLIFGDQKAARRRVVALVQAIGLRGIEAGSLANSAAAEAMTSVLIFINKAYQVGHAGIQITGNLAAPAE
jgi:hypothetical protein